MALTKRELEVAREAALGTPSKEIAAKLNCANQTVRGHLNKIYRVMGIRGTGAQRKLMLRAGELGKDAA